LSANVGVGNALVIGGIDGREYNFLIFQPITGNLTWIWPSNFRGAGNIGINNFNASSNTYGIQTFLYGATANVFYALTPLSIIS
jgi:hypothetical protein